MAEEDTGLRDTLRWATLARCGRLLIGQPAGHEIDEAVRSLSIAFSAGETRTAALEVERVFTLGVISARRGLPLEAELHLRASLQLFERAGDTLSAAHARSQLAWVARDQRRFELASRLYAENLEFFRTASSPYDLAVTLMNFAVLLRRAGAHSSATEHALEALSLLEEAGAIHDYAITKYALALWFYEDGRRDAAMEQAEQTWDILREHPERDSMAHVGLLFGELLLNSGEVSRALDVLTEARDAAERDGNDELSVQCDQLIERALLQAASSPN